MRERRAGQPPAIDGPGRSVTGRRSPRGLQPGGAAIWVSGRCGATSCRCEFVTFGNRDLRASEAPRTCTGPNGATCTTHRRTATPQVRALIPRSRPTSENESATHAGLAATVTSGTTRPPSGATEDSPSGTPAKSNQIHGIRLDDRSTGHRTDPGNEPKARRFIHRSGNG